LDQRYHQSILRGARRRGRTLLTRILLGGGSPKNGRRHQDEDIDATLEELRNTHPNWYAT